MLSRLTGTIIELEGNQALFRPLGSPGMCFEVLVPGYLAMSLREHDAVGEDALHQPASVDLWTLEYLESQNQGSSFIPRLIGFGSAREREFFELLTSVKGLGNKRALRAMTLAPGSIARAIADRDARRLQSLPEIGPKLADLIVHELKSKVDRFLAGESPAEMAQSPLNAVEPKPAPSATKPRRVLGAEKTEKAAAAPAPATRVATAPTTPAPPPPMRQTIEALIALGESPVDAERMVAKAIDRARAGGGQAPSTTSDLLAAAYAAR